MFYSNFKINKFKYSNLKRIMDYNANNNSPLSSISNSKKKIKTVYINDLESLNDSTENIETIYYNHLKNEKITPDLKTKGKISNSKINENILINKNGNENHNIKNNSLNKEKKNNKEKFENFMSIKLKNKNNLSLLSEEEKKNEKKNKNNNNVLKISKKNVIRKNKKNNLKINAINEKEIEMLKEIEFLKNEIKLKDEIIKKLINENKKLIDKIKTKEIDLLNSKNNEKNLTKAVQENNKCICILNELILKYIPYNNKKNDNESNKEKNAPNLNIDNYMSAFDDLKSKEKKNDNTKRSYINKNTNIQLKKDINKLPNGNSVQRYFKMHTRNITKRNIPKNQYSNQNYKSSNVDIKDNNFTREERTNNNYDKLKRNNTMALDSNKHNNNNYSDVNIVNGDLNDFGNIRLIKSFTNNNIFKKKVKKNYIRYNLNFLEDNISDFNNDYYTGNMSCKNVKIEKKMVLSPKKVGTGSNYSIKENFSFSNIFNNHKNNPIPKYNYIIENINDNDDKRSNFNCLKHLNYSQIEMHNKLKNNKNIFLTDLNINGNNEKSFFLKNKINIFPKYELTSGNIKKEKVKIFSPINTFESKNK